MNYEARVHEILEVQDAQAAAHLFKSGTMYSYRFPPGLVKTVYRRCMQYLMHISINQTLNWPYYENHFQQKTRPFSINPAKASGCLKEHLKNAYLLYYDTIHIAVYNQHPKDNFKLIESLIKIYQTDTTRLSKFVHFDSSINITVTRLCKDKTNEIYHNEYVDWRVIEY